MSSNTSVNSTTSASTASHTLTSHSNQDYDHLKNSNHRLQATVQELRLELCYFKGEIKRLEYEKKLLKQDADNVSKLFKAWVNEFYNGRNRSILQNAEQLQIMTKYPPIHINDILKIKDTMIILTTCQPPFYIEYANKCWSDFCEWEPHLVVGYTCSFLQGKGTNLKTASTLTKDVCETGYGSMRIHNYKKNGQMFRGDVTVFPVYDTMVAVGENCELPVLTHFASVLSNVEIISESEMCQISCTSGVNDCSVVSGGIPITTILSSLNNSTTNKLNGDTTADSHVENKKRSNVDQNVESINENEKVKDEPIFDRRINSKSVKTKLQMTQEKFLELAINIRISDLLRLIMICSGPMVLTDAEGKILHVNKHWVDLCGYDIRDVDGKTCSILQGPLTDNAQIVKAKLKMRAGLVAKMSVINYKKNGTTFYNDVVIVPVKGGYNSCEVTHYCGYLETRSYNEEQTIPLDNDDERHINKALKTDHTF